MTLNKQAILFGATIDLGLSAFFSQIIYAIAGYWLIAKGTPAGEVIATANSHYLFYYLLTGLGLGFDIIGGYTAAKIANQNHLIHSAVASLPVLIFNLLSYLNPSSSDSLFWSLLCVPAFIYGGGVLHCRTRRSSGTRLRRAP